MKTKIAFWTWDLSGNSKEMKNETLPVRSESSGSITVNKHFLNALFCTAYRRGHEDTVEGCYTDVLSNDWDTYFDEETTEILEESNAPDELPK